MANAEQAPAMTSPVRTDEQIVPRNRWVPIRKSNCYLNEEKSQRNPIFKIAVDILMQTNFFRAFTASLTIPAIYIQQFWDTIRFDSKAGSYKCQLDEQWFNLTQDTFRDALQITPVDNNRAFFSPPTPDTLVEFVNKLGYPKEVMHLFNVTTNDMFQPWRALATIINLINKLESVDVSKMIREQTVEFIDSQEIERKINESVKEVVSSSVKHAMRAPLRARFKDLPTSDMKVDMGVDIES
ncbi:hypothetical protein Tco_0783987 [Tanacetum coccineum]